MRHDHVVHQVIIVLTAILLPSIAQAMENYLSVKGGGAEKGWVLKAHESCNEYLTNIVLQHPGCESRNVTSIQCYGSCRSRVTPDWEPIEEKLRMIKACSCCKPLQRKFRYVTLKCAGVGAMTSRSVMVTAATECACRPCSSAHGVRARKPYDY